LGTLAAQGISNPTDAQLEVAVQGEMRSGGGIDPNYGVGTTISPAVPRPSQAEGVDMSVFDRQAHSLAG
jgi:hypothetical protein